MEGIMTWGRKGQSAEAGSYETKEERAAKLPLTAKQMAEVFVNMDDELQADFFIQVAEIAKSWDEDQAIQWKAVGSHLATCECSTPAAQEMILDLVHGYFFPKEEDE